MNRDDLTRLHHDRRLLRRKGWIAAEEAEAALRELPDAAAKATTLGEVEDSQKSAGGDEAPPAS